MPSPEFHEVPVRACQPETSSLFLIRLGPLPPALVSSHARAGQYVAVRAPGVEPPSYLAIASPLGASELELLVRDRGGDFARGMRRLRPGDTVAVSTVMGPGYPLAETGDRELWLVGVGTGISALRPVALVVLREPSRRAHLHLLFGAQTAADFPFRAELAAWRQAGVEVILTASREPADAGWDGERGYVQDVLRRRRPDLAHAEVFICGMQGMVEGVTAVTHELGLAPGRLHTNY